MVKKTQALCSISPNVLMDIMLYKYQASFAIMVLLWQNKAVIKNNLKVLCLSNRIVIL